MNKLIYGIRFSDALLGFGAGYGTYEISNNVISALIVGIAFTILMSSVKSKKKNDNDFDSGVEDAMKD